MDKCKIFSIKRKTKSKNCNKYLHFKKPIKHLTLFSHLSLPILYKLLPFLTFSVLLPFSPFLSYLTHRAKALSSPLISHNPSYKASSLLNFLSSSPFLSISQLSHSQGQSPLISTHLTQSILHRCPPIDQHHNPLFSLALPWVQ